ncbi:cancer-related nucleoside-triphosphatase homolog [Phtheirospermum japonicum]|uniref:Cancer-related nucleoside-triphosphatase homolog n=1 Tax=Phtheirospermum japonicum TaxID=374723 RepID=A0A830D3Y0_9LAMI|nr:cancer-related nucleoside-triphosphatase homolog [Phtheirospermum japonicum]
MAGAGKCFLVAGSPGVGKTTLIVRVLESLKQSNPSLNIQGFYTREVREGAQRVGFEVVTLDGRRAPLASTNISRIISRLKVSEKDGECLDKLCSQIPESQRWPNLGRYKVDISSFESLALPELQVKEDTGLFIIDEVGKMELFSSSFFPAVLRVLESNIPLLASVPVPKSGRDIPAVARLKNHPGATVYTLNTSNRDAMKEQIYSNLADIWQIH